VTAPKPALPSAEELAAAERAAQGLPAQISDPSVMHRIAVLMSPAPTPADLASARPRTAAGRGGHHVIAKKSPGQRAS